MNYEKEEQYQLSLRQIESVLEGVDDEIAKMATISCILKTNHPTYFWSGFYRVVDQVLMVGPYQGTMGCLRIEFGKGVCGTCALTGEAQIVQDVHQFEGHIACDAKSKSEIVVPVRDKTGALIAVFDVDSTEIGSFDELDQAWLGKIMARFFG